MATSVADESTRVRVSSVLNRDVKQFGKKFLLDGQEATCWNSDQGSPQWIKIELDKKVELQELHIQFQGGFAGRECWVESIIEGSEVTKVMEFYPEDINSLQVFKVPVGVCVSTVRIVFNTSTDFFGRITIYKLDLIGSPPVVQ